MARQKRFRTKPLVLADDLACNPGKAGASGVAVKVPTLSDDTLLVPASKLRRMLGVTPVTLWRWRHDERTSFPHAKLINGRLYFTWVEVQAWVERQQAA